MTEQYTPSDYDLHVQNPRIDQLESLITAEYQPPAGVEYSFPVANQGITQEQFRLMHLGQANGMIHGDNGTVNDSPNSTGYRYYLEGHATDSETNQRNTLILRAGTSAEAIVEGFYHRLTEDMELPFPPVTSTTLYRVTLTYDPRKFKTSPVNIEVWAGEPPTAYGQVHVLLHTVERQPSQLLSQATITRHRPYTAGIVAVQNPNQLPDVDSYPAGTLAVPSSTEATGVYVRSNTSPKRWVNTMVGPWQDMTLWGDWQVLRGRPGYRVTPMGLQFRGHIRYGAGGATSEYMTRWTQLPTQYRPSSSFRTPVWASPMSADPSIEIDTDGSMRLNNFSQSTFYGLSLDNIFMPLD